MTFLALLLVAAAPPPDPALDPSLNRARAEEQRLSDASVRATAAQRDADAAVAVATQRVLDVSEQRRGAETRLRERAAAIAPLLPLAERLGLFPAETLLAVPAPPEQAIRGLTVLHGLMRTVELQAAQLRAELAQVEAAQRALDDALPRLRAARAAQATQSALLDRELALARTTRAHIEDAAADQARRSAAEASRAETVTAALETMATSRAHTQALLEQDAERAERQRREAALVVTRQRQAQIGAPAGPGVHPVKDGGGGVLPVSGPVVRRWGDPTEAGPAHGIAFRAPPQSRVVAPCAGRVAFAGPFRSYGMLVILDCGAGYHFVLAGLDRLDTQAGDPVQPGEPLGTMPDWNPADAAQTGDRPALYVELRFEGRPIDPAPFMRTGS